MSICLETTKLLSAATPTTSSSVEEPPSSSATAAAVKNVAAKIIVANPQQAAAPATGGGAHQPPPPPAAAQMKIVGSPSLITVMNAPGPITVVKSSSLPSQHITLVNSAPLKSAPTITLVNAAPITVVKAIPGPPPSEEAGVNNGIAAASEKPAALHNVLVKKAMVGGGGTVATCEQDVVVPQSHKILTANSFPSTNVVQGNAAPLLKTVNGQRPVGSNKVKILSNVIMPSSMTAGPSNVLLSKTVNQRIFHQKSIGNGAATKYLNKPITTSTATVGSAVPPKLGGGVMQKNPSVITEKSQPQKIIYAGPKGQIKTLSSTFTNFTPVTSKQQQQQPLKALSPQQQAKLAAAVPKPGPSRSPGVVAQQRPPRPPGKPNYIGKHAIQAQKLKQPPQKRKPSPFSQYQNRPNQVTFNQALTAQILETLGTKSSSYEPPYYSEQHQPRTQPVATPSAAEPRIDYYKPQSNLDTLSFVCQAVLLDHNYNATLPMDSPPPAVPGLSPGGPPVQNGGMYSPGGPTAGLKKQRFGGVLTPTNTLSSLSSISLAQGGGAISQEDDAASDISCGSDRKLDTEGEETDTAPEAEAVTNDDQFDRYGDYVTRCICGFIHDDGYMIECDQCKVWQHVRCVVKTKKVPDDYLCEVCDPSKPTDRQKARALQQQWMREVQERDAKLRKEQLKEQQQQRHQQQQLSDSDSSDVERPAHNNNISCALGKNRNNNNNRKSAESIKQRQRREREKRQLKRKMTKRKARTHSKTVTSDEERIGGGGGGTTGHNVLQLRQWIDNYEEAVTNHYSPELRARISNIRINGAYSELSGQVDPQIQRCKLQTNSNGTKCLITTVPLQPGTPVIELRGKYMLSTQHHRAPSSSFNAQGLGTATAPSSSSSRQQRPGPFLFFYRLPSGGGAATEVCVDTRTYGNAARFVRRSCRPNAELRHCIEKGVLHLYVVARGALARDVELTVRHEAHDAPAAAECACGDPDACALKVTVRKNGEAHETNHRKRRGRRTSSSVSESGGGGPGGGGSLTTVAASGGASLQKDNKVVVKEEAVTKEENDEKEEKIVDEKVEVKREEIKVEVEEVKAEEIKEEIKEEDEPNTPRTAAVVPPVSSRRSSSHHKSDPEELRKDHSPTQSDDKDKKKLSREERKLQAIMKAIERMEKQEQRKQEHQAKQAHRRESEPTPHAGKEAASEDRCIGRGKRRKRKGRTRTLSANSAQGGGNRRNRLNSADSAHATSSDETLLSPNDQSAVTPSSPRKAAGLLLAFSNGDGTTNEEKSPERISTTADVDSNSNSSPETPLSSACLLVAAAVEPLEPGFKFPKTKKGLMNEWLNKGTEQPSPTTVVATDSVYDTNTGFYAPTKNLVALAQAAATTFCSNTQPRVNAKKRWLRQAISEDQCDSPNGSGSRPESPPTNSSEAPIAPPKKRRLPRESLSTDSQISAKTGPDDEDTNGNGLSEQDSPPASANIIEHTEAVIPSPVLTGFEQQEFVRKDFGSLLDPRLSRGGDRPPPLFSNSDHLVGTVEKTLTFLGFQDAAGDSGCEKQKPEAITPMKRKLSITEYRQRKKLTTSDKQEEGVTEEVTASQSPRALRNRSNSSSSTSCPTSDEEVSTNVLQTPKVLSAFNSEPTELERQRENVSLRLKKALGLTLDTVEARKPALNMESILKCDLPVPPKATTALSCPTFPIPGAGDSAITSESPPAPPNQDRPPPPHPPPPYSPTTPKDSPASVQYVPHEAPGAATPPPTAIVSSEERPPPPPSNREEEGGGGGGGCRDAEAPRADASVLYYTVDEEEAGGASTAAAAEAAAAKGATAAAERRADDDVVVGYVPPFNNPLYPNSSYTNYGSVIDDDTAPYEGRNPSPPPNHSGDDGAQ